MLTVSRTDTQAIPVIDGEVIDTTVPIPAPWLRPPVTTRYRSTPRGRLARLVARVRRSAFVADVTGRLRIIPEAVGALAVVYLGVLVLRGVFVLASLAGVR